MKRTLVLLTLFCLFLSGTVGVAEDTQKEILFRGIPWGISLTDFVETMETSGFSGTVSSDNTINSWEWEPVVVRTTPIALRMLDIFFIRMMILPLPAFQ